jgi:hypothetical protein
MTCKLCDKKIHALELCTIHWRELKYGLCISGCAQPANGTNGLCPNCIKRGGAAPSTRRDGSCNACHSKLVDFRCTTCDVRRKKNENLMRNYRISLEVWEDIFSKQGNVCLICSKDSRRFVVDHDHECCPGKKTCGRCIRGIICENCNKTLGLIKDSKETLINMIKYLS